MNKKNIMIIIGVVLIISITSIILIVINNNKKAENNKQSTIEEGQISKEEIKVENIVFTDVKLKFDGGITTLTAKVKSNKNIDSIKVKISFLDENGNEIKNTIQLIENITNEEQVFTTGFVGDYENSNKVVFEIVGEE